METDPHTPDEEGFIPFIHNYCDRWCEQCRFIAQCRVGIEELDAEEGGFKRRTLDESLREVRANLEKVPRMLEEMARERGIDWEELIRDLHENRGKYEREHEAKRRRAREHPLGALATEYALAMMDWTAAHRAPLEDAFRAMAARAEMDIGPEERTAAAQRLHDALEVLARCAMPIGSKVNRALMGRADGPDAWDEAHPHQSDVNGSAKVARILVERSMAAWKAVMDAVPAVVDDALPLMARLQRLHALLWEEFPHHDAFVRPGFDGPQGP